MRVLAPAVVVVSLLLTAGAGAMGQQRGPRAAPTSAVRGATLVVLARLVDAPTGLPHCGIMSVVATVRYEVVTVLRGRYRPSTLYAVHLCPELSRVIAQGPNAGTVESFHRGELHRLWLRPIGDVLRRQAVDRYGDPSIPRFETLRADIERPPT